MSVIVPHRRKAFQGGAEVIVPTVYIPLDEGSGTSAAIIEDGTDNGDTASLNSTGGAWLTSPTRWDMTTGGWEDWVRTDDGDLVGLHGLTEVTMMVRVHASATQATVEGLISWGFQWDEQALRLDFCQVSATRRDYAWNVIKNSVTYTQTYSNTSADDGSTLMELAASCDSDGNMAIIENGVELDTDTHSQGATGSIYDPTSPVRRLSMGDIPNMSGSSVTGEVSDLAVHNTKLTTAEIAAWFASL